jgi:hypothetical protein
MELILVTCNGRTLSPLNHPGLKRRRNGHGSLAKDLKYWYQFEARLLLLPKKKQSLNKLEPLVLSIGSVKDITSTFHIF